MNDIQFYYLLFIFIIVWLSNIGLIVCYIAIRAYEIMHSLASHTDNMQSNQRIKENK